MSFIEISEIILPFIGVVLLIYSIFLAIKAEITKKWYKTTGVVVKSELKKTSTGAGYDAESQSYKASIQYNYKVDDIEYISNRIFYGDIIGTPLPFKSKSLVKLYSKNLEVTVYYNPRKPKESVLQKGLKFIVIEIFIIGSLFVLLGILIVKYESIILSFFSC